MEGVLWENAGSEEKSMSIWMKETVPGKKKRPGQDKNIQDLKEENIQRPQVKLNTQPAKRTSSSVGNTGFRFEEWPDEQESNGKRVVSQTPTPPLPSTREPEYRAKDGLGSTHQWPCSPPWGTGGRSWGWIPWGDSSPACSCLGRRAGITQYNSTAWGRRRSTPAAIGLPPPVPRTGLTGRSVGPSRGW